MAFCQHYFKISPQRTGLCLYTAVINFSDGQGIDDLDFEEEITTANMLITESQQDLNPLC
jgi:hypothetical protein